jgi:4-hydroxy-tetrahydrodipicolinate synthase
MSIFSGIWVPLVTPFAAGQVDHAALRRLTAFYAGQPLGGLVVLGSTGEAAALDAAEQLAVLDTVLAACGSLPVVVGLAGNHLGEVLERLQDFASRPIAGVLTPAPYYVRPAQAGLLAWFRALADASPVPLVLYDIPYRTGVRLELATLLELAGHPNIRAIKDCGGAVETTRALIADGRLQVLAGEDAAIFSTLCMGGSGAIAASAHIHPQLFCAMHEALRGQRLEEARAIYQTLAPLLGILFSEPNPAPLKALLAVQGWLANELRLPLTPASPALGRQLQTVLAALDRQAAGFAADRR